MVKEGERGIFNMVLNKTLYKLKSTIFL
jgi:hypothetical protein